MINYLKKNSMKIGMLLFAAYQLVTHIVTLSNAIAIPFCLTGIAFMMIGLFNSEQCRMRRENNRIPGGR